MVRVLRPEHSDPMNPGAWYAILLHPMADVGKSVAPHRHEVLVVENAPWMIDTQNVGIGQRFLTQAQAEAYADRIRGNLRQFKFKCACCYPSSRAAFWLIP